MQKFVDQIATFLKESDIPLTDWVVILPSERAKHYVQKALFEAYGKPILSPQIHTIYRWIQELTPETILDKSRLLLALYEIHLKRENQQDPFVFDEYLNWGTILLSDFDELDRYLIDSKQLFRNLKDIKEIENWSFGEDKELSPSQQRFLEFWDRLPGYYAEFNALLKTKNALYIGKAYRNVTENPDRFFRDNPNAHFLFAGFNALSKAEKTIFKQLHRLGRGHVLINADAYYLNDKNHEAGNFLRDVLEFLDLKQPDFVQDELANTPKKIEVISCAQTTGQAKVVGTLLENLTLEEVQETMILLADESLIVPLLQHIPAHVKQANITLGLPLRNSALRTWVELIFHIQEGFLKYNRVVAYHKDLMRTWNHPFVLALLSDREVQEIYAIEKDIRKWNRIFQDPSKIQVNEKVKTILNLLYTPWKQDWSFAMQVIRQLNALIHDQIPKSSEFEKAFLQGFDSALIDFQNVIQEGIPTMSLRSFKTLFNQQWTGESISFFGNPLEGLQIMGLLETRLLDFKRIYVIGLNEGKMPPTNPIQTMIPMDLRKFFELPTPREKQGLFAHHFYRLLHQCEEMVITYSAASESINSNEESRYIKQLELELARINPQIQFVKRDYSLASDGVKAEDVSIEKTPEVLSRMDELFRLGTSASAIKTYLTCPLDFYYKYILKFGEEEKVEEEVEHNTFGTFIHAVLEELYTPFSRRDAQGNLKENQPPSLQVEDIERMLKQYEYLMRQKFSAHFNNDPTAFETGKNFLSFSMALELTKRFLETEKKYILSLNNQPFFIEALEERLEYELELQVAGEKRIIKLKGFVDRIDSVDGRIRILDYKSGKVESKDVGSALSKFQGSMEEGLVKLALESKHFLQLMIYNYLYYKKYEIVPHSSAIISFVRLNESPFTIVAKDYSVTQIIESFPNVLEELLNEMYNTEKPFEHTKEFFNYCAYC